MTTTYRSALGLEEPAWRTSPCSGLRFRQWPDGRIEIEGRGFEVCPKNDWRPGVDNWHKTIWDVSKKQGVPAHWIAAIMAIESSGKPNLKVGKYHGLMMLGMPAAKEAAKSLGLPAPTVDQLVNDSALNVALGTAYLKQQLALPKVAGAFPLAAVAYNAGGVYCGNGCAIRDKATDTCTLRCPPNEWGLVGECNLRGDQWIPGTYATKATRFSNWAFLNGFGPGMDKLDWPPGKTPVPPQPQPETPEETPASSYWLAALAGVALGVGAVYAYHHVVALAPYRRRLARA